MQQNYGFYTIYSMKELIHYRATIFVESPIGYTKDNVDMFPLKDWKCMPLTNDANTQAINPFEIISKTKDFDGAEWKAINLEKGFSIVFWGTKIDILGQPFVDEHSFVQMSKQIFEQFVHPIQSRKLHVLPIVLPMVRKMEISQESLSTHFIKEQRRKMLPQEVSIEWMKSLMIRM